MFEILYRVPGSAFRRKSFADAAARDRYVARLLARSPDAEVRFSA